MLHPNAHIGICIDQLAIQKTLIPSPENFWIRYLVLTNFKKIPIILDVLKLLGLFGLTAF